MHVDMKLFLQSGQFGTLDFGSTRRVLTELLGEPDDWYAKSSRDKSRIWLYGSFEFSFPKDGDGLHMIFSDHFDPFEGSKQIAKCIMNECANSVA